MTNEPELPIADRRLDRRVLILDGERKHRAWLSRIARSVVSDVDVVSSYDPDTDPEKYDLVIVHREGLDEEDRGRVFDALRSTRSSPRAAHPLLVSSADRGYLDLFQEFRTYGLMNLLAKNERVSGIELIVTMQKILLKDVFSLEKYFGWGVPARSRLVKNSDERESVRKEAEAYASNLGVPSRLVERFCMVLDELLSNALYNAPVDARGEPRYAHLARTVPVSLEPGEEVVVSFCCDANLLGVSVADTFGALDADQCLEHLVRCFRKDGDQVEQKAGGAGLGLYFSFESLSQLAINIAPGRRTEVVGLLDIRGTYRDFASRNKSFNVFVEAEGSEC